jgi:hypothetical protein
MAKLKKKNPKSHPQMAPPDIPPGGTSAPHVIRARPAYDIISTVSITMTSSHGDLKYLLLMWHSSLSTDF